MDKWFCLTTVIGVDFSLFYFTTLEAVGLLVVEAIMYIARWKLSCNCWYCYQSMWYPWPWLICPPTLVNKPSSNSEMLTFFEIQHGGHLGFSRLVNLAHSAVMTGCLFRKLCTNFGSNISHRTTQICSRRSTDDVMRINFRFSFCYMSVVVLHVSIKSSANIFRVLRNSVWLLSAIWY